MSHLLMSYSYVGKVWVQMDFKQQKIEPKEFNIHSLIMYWDIWLVRNVYIFKDKYIPPFQCASQIRNFFGSFIDTPLIHRHT